MVSYAHGKPIFIRANRRVRLEAIYGKTREANRGSASSPEAGLEEASAKLIETNL